MKAVTDNLRRSSTPMTSAERSKPELIDHSRRLRIAKGAGVEPHEVNKTGSSSLTPMRETMQRCRTSA